MKYQPEPIDTANVGLTAESLKLAELLAKNSHALWAKRRLAETWRYDSQGAEAQQEHPDLVPFEALSDEAQQYYRMAALEMLKTLFALGYRLEVSESANTNLLEEQDLSLILQGLKVSSELSLSSLLDLRRETMRLGARTPEVYRALGNAILQIGEPLMAYDVLAEGLQSWAGDLRLQQLLALSLARSGATMAANSLLQKLVQAGQQDNETLGLLARTHKDLWQQATEPTVRNYHLHLAAKCYRQAHERTGSVWTGINAATLTMIMGQTDRARALAKAVRDHCLQKLQADPNNSKDYWLLATLGEAALILGEQSEAEAFYGQAAAIGQGRFGDLSSSRRNAMLLTQYLGGDDGQIQQLFQLPRVVVFCGHMIDRPTRSQQRFPQHLESAVYHAILDRLRQLDVRLGYASAACGSDILFLEALRELKGELHIALPYNRDQFLQDSVNLIPDANWGDRFEQLMQQATEVIIASGQNRQDNDVVYEYSNRLLHGLAKMRAEQLGTSLIPLTVWDGRPGDGPGGTANTVTLWKCWAEHVEVIDLAALLQESLQKLPVVTLASSSAASSPPHAATQPEALPLNVERQIRALLFADVVHYSQMADDQFLPFVEHFLGAIAGLASQPDYQPLVQNTWGDALYAVFPTVEQAGQFALDLCDLVQSIDWSTKGLPHALNLRVALHAGPVDRHLDPITGQINYIGAHVNHTARIEPITPPGKVYASQAFAAIAASEGLKHFTCDYVGQMPWAKEYGTFPTYHVHRSLSTTDSPLA